MHRTWYYVYCQRAGVEHQYYARMDSDSSDILHDHLDRTCSVCQVVPVGRKRPVAGVPEI